MTFITSSAGILTASPLSFFTVALAADRPPNFVFVLGDHLQTPSADLSIVSEHGSLTGFALFFLLMRTFSSGCAALTGVEAISNGVPAFRKPKSKNAAMAILAEMAERLRETNAMLSQRAARDVVKEIEENLTWG